MSDAPENTNKNKSMKIGYARVSTDDQTVYQYEDALRDFGCDPRRIFIDPATNALAKNRPGLQDARAAMRPGYSFVVLDIDRAFRSTMEGLLFLDDILKEGMDFISIHEPYDTRTPEGYRDFIRAVADAEYERKKISRRTRLKMAAAKRRGVHLGRKPSLSDEQIQTAHRMISLYDANIQDCANALNVHQRTLARSFRRIGLAA